MHTYTNSFIHPYIHIHTRTHTYIIINFFYPTSLFSSLHSFYPSLPPLSNFIITVSVLPLLPYSPS